ncbi:MAG: hypothetical protein O3B01_29705 [Planctomycetota bacterium]|nr:hypothetical protein [Planctomycetota bacterium]
MSGIGPMNAFALAGSEVAKKERPSKKENRTAAASIPASKNMSEFDEGSTSRLLQMAREALSGDHTLRPELMEAIQARLGEGFYEDQEVLARVAEKLLYMMKAELTH